MHFRIVRGDVDSVKADAVLDPQGLSNETLAQAVKNGAATLAVLVENRDLSGESVTQVYENIVSNIRSFTSDEEVELIFVLGNNPFSVSDKLYGDIDGYLDKYLVPEFDPAGVPGAPASAAMHSERQSILYSEATEEETPYRPKRQKKFRLGKAVCKDISDESICNNISGMSFSEQAFQSAAAMGIPAHGEKARSLDEAIKNLDKSFMELVFYHADLKGISDTELQKRANIDRKAFSKLRCGTTKNPSKPTALALALALELNIDDSKDLLSRAGFALSPCSRQDLIVRYFIEREIYDIYAVNLALFEHGEPTLGTQG